MLSSDPHNIVLNAVLGVYRRYVLTLRVAVVLVLILAYCWRCCCFCCEVWLLR